MAIVYLPGSSGVKRASILHNNRGQRTRKWQVNWKSVNHQRPIYSSGGHSPRGRGVSIRVGFVSPFIGITWGVYIRRVGTTSSSVDSPQQVRRPLSPGGGTSLHPGGYTVKHISGGATTELLPTWPENKKSEKVFEVSCDAIFIAELCLCLISIKFVEFYVKKTLDLKL